MADSLRILIQTGWAITALNSIDRWILHQLLTTAFPLITWRCNRVFYQIHVCCRSFCVTFKLGFHHYACNATQGGLRNILRTQHMQHKDNCSSKNLTQCTQRKVQQRTRKKNRTGSNFALCAYGWKLGFSLHVKFHYLLHKSFSIFHLVNVICIELRHNLASKASAQIWHTTVLTVLSWCNYTKPLVVCEEIATLSQRHSATCPSDHSHLYTLDFWNSEISKIIARIHLLHITLQMQNPQVGESWLQWSCYANIVNGTNALLLSVLRQNRIL